jgi:ABC-2 type transport system permease protein
VLALLPIGTAQAFAQLYGSETSRAQLAATVGSNPALVSFLGPVYGSSIGALTAWRVGTLGTLLAGLMAVLTVIRHTRDEEETGRRELIGSTVVGRHAPLTAAVVVMVVGGGALGGVIALGLIGLGLPAVGSIAFGAGFTTVTAVFAALGAVAAQLTESGGSARGIAVSVLGLSFLLRAAGDGGEASGLGWLSWLSPIGWFTRLRPFAGERWSLIGLLIPLAVGLGWLAFRMSARRDVGAGMFPPRIGPASAAPSLSTSLGLAWRLQRPALFGWSAGVLVIGVVYGSIGNSVGDLLADNPQLQEIFEALGGEQGLTDTFFATAMGFLALISTAYAIRSALRLRTEEESLRAELILATATPRVRWATSHLTFAVVGPLLMLAIAGAVSALTFGAIGGDLTGRLGQVVGSALLQVPAVWVLVGVSTALFGLAPRAMGLSWGALVVCLVLGQLGPLFRLPQWALDLSPLTHVPTLPSDEFSLVPVLVLAAVAAGLLAVGLAGFNRRDLQPG